MMRHATDRRRGRIPRPAALETAGLMLGSDKSRGYCLEMICADFLAGVSLEAGDRDALLPCLIRLAIGLPRPQRNQLLEEVQETL